MSERLSIAQGTKFQVDAETSGDHLTLFFSGSINEDIWLADLMRTLGGLQSTIKRIIFDLSGATDINSCGVRTWLLFLERAEATMTVEFQFVSEVFIEQSGIVPQMLGKKGNRVEAFEATYYCSHCSIREGKRVPRNLFPDFAITFAPPVFPCGKCAKKMEFDGLEEAYGTFLSHTRS